MFRLLSFYKYIQLDDPEKLREEIHSFCLSRNIRGKIYLAGEGINGNVSGADKDVEKFKAFLIGFDFFEDIIFKEEITEGYVFSRMNVRLKRELVHLGIPASDLRISEQGKKITPEKLFDLYRAGEEFIIVDVRNWYESRIGKFKNAITPGMKNFREWPEEAEKLSEFRDKTIVTYCTGGIRCEKASAYLVHNGFKDVYQLEGGIASYVKKFPDTFWQGGVFVFDERKVVEPNSKEELKYTASCVHCGRPSAYYINCHNLDCDKIIVVCSECKYKFDYCCSTECMKAGNMRERYYD